MWKQQRGTRIPPELYDVGNDGHAAAYGFMVRDVDYLGALRVDDPANVDHVGIYLESNLLCVGDDPSPDGIVDIPFERPIPLCRMPLYSEVMVWILVHREPASFPLLSVRDDSAVAKEWDDGAWHRIRFFGDPTVGRSRPRRGSPEYEGWKAEFSGTPFNNFLCVRDGTAFVHYGDEPNVRFYRSH